MELIKLILKVLTKLDLIEDKIESVNNVTPWECPECGNTKYHKVSGHKNKNYFGRVRKCTVCASRFIFHEYRMENKHEPN